MSRTRRHRTRRRREAVAAILPNLLTLGNAACGFGAIVHIANISVADPPSIQAMLNHPNVQIAALLVLVAMVFDVLDGSVARMTRQTSDLGAQLDSLSDAISFGVAPAFLVWRVVHVIPEGPGHLPSRLGWALALLYLCCAALRLARFNVEAGDADSHDTFHGLPTPGAAGAVVAPFLLLHDEAANLPSWLCTGVAYALPLWGVVIGALMVSRVPFVHFGSWLFRGKKPFDRLVLVLFALPLVALFPYYAAALGFVGFACTGPMLVAWRWMHRGRTAPARPTEPA